ncbi:MAG: HTH domain-containing protein [Candidatus Aenigmarchaeota archaeon]|nr:HTH domain-containing protein [Candidatus Aenigmarchaeota archaeon]
MKDNGEKLKERIVEMLEKHHEGLTIVELSRILSSHRQTVTKYILWLEGAGTVHRRRVGAVTLHYLKKEWERLRK